MSLYRFASACDTTDDAPASPVNLAAGEPEQVAPLPRPRHRSADTDYRGLFDASLVADLRASADSGAALDAIAPITAAHAETGAPRGAGLLVIVGLAILASRLS